MFGDGIEHIGYDKLLTLSTCLAENVITNDRLQELLTLHRTDITKLLKELCNNDLLISEGTGRGTKYYLKGKVDTLEGKVDTSERKVDTFCSEDTIIRDKSHLKRNELEQLIMENAKEYVSLEEIASRTGKKASYLKNKIIPEMWLGATNWKECITIHLTTRNKNTRQRKNKNNKIRDGIQLQRD